MSLGYDPTLSVEAQLEESKKTLARYLANGRDGTAVVEAVRQQIADLEQVQRSHAETRVREGADLAAHAEAHEAKIKGSIVAQQKAETTSGPGTPPAVSHRDQEHQATQFIADLDAELAALNEVAP